MLTLNKQVSNELKTLTDTEKPATTAMEELPMATAAAAE